MKRGIVARAALALSVAVLGIQSAVVQQASAAPGVPSAPSTVNVTVLAATSVQVSWSTPAANGGTINGYIVEESLDNFATPAINRWTPMGNSLLVDNLVPGELVWFHVAATTAAVTGVFSASVSATPSSPPDAPTDLVYTKVHPPSLDIAWTPPLNNGSAISQYIVDDARAVPAEISSTGDSSCVLVDVMARTQGATPSGDVKCWGDNSFFQLGVLTPGHTNWGARAGETGTSAHTVDLGAGRTATKVVVGGDHACAIRDDGSVYCWGNNSDGRLGVGTTGGNSAGVVNLGTVSPGMPHLALDIAAGTAHTCAVLDDYTVKCWGMNDKGQLGLGDTVLRGGDPLAMGDALSPVSLLAPVGEGYHWPVSLSAGGNHTCALFSDAKVKCWGENSHGELGLEDTFDRGALSADMGASLPFLSLGTGFDVSSLSAADGDTCAVGFVGGNSALKCWGRNNYGQLGQGDIIDRGGNVGDMGDNLAPVDLGGMSPSNVAIGSRHTCADVTDPNAVPGQFMLCWGYNAYGALGLGNTQSYGDAPNTMGANLPVVDLGLMTFADISVGTDFSCVVFNENNSTSSNTASCWGVNNAGQLGMADNLVRGDTPATIGANLRSSLASLHNYYPIPDPTSTLTSATLTNLATGVPHFLRILARNASGVSPYSLENPVLMVGTATAPTGLSWIGRTSTSVDLVWASPADPGSSITDSVVQYSTDGGTNWTDFVPSPAIGVNSQVSVTGLTPGVNTTFRVAAINAIGRGDWSDPISVTPMRAPDQIDTPIVTSIQATSAVVNWTLPADNGSPISGIVVEYGVYGQNSWTPVNLGPTATSTTLTGLVPNLRYEVRVTAQNHAGANINVPISGLTSSPAAFTTVVGAPLFQSVVRRNNAPATPYDSYTVVTWTAPVPNGLASAIGSYYIQYRKAGDAWPDAINLGNVSTYTLDNLEPGATYEVQLWAHNATGDGVIATTSFTAASVPSDAPLHLVSDAQFAGAAGLTWDAPAYTGGSTITDYKVEYSEDGGTSWHIFNHPASQNTTILVSGLVPGASYVFRVSAVNGAGAGLASSFAFATTIRSAQRITDLQATHVFGRRVVLSWSTPSAPLSQPVTNYRIEWSVNGIDFQPWAHDPSSETTAIIDGLQLNTDYVFRVTPFNGAYGQSSNIVDAVTLDVPAAVDTISVTPGATGATVTWTAPSWNGGSDITDYVLRYRVYTGLVPGDWQNVTRSTSTETTQLLVGLVHTTKYDVEVAAVNEPGNSPWSTPRQFVTLADAPGAPASTTLTAGNSAVLVAWTPPTDNGGANITSYEVQRQAGAGDWVVAKTGIASTARSYVVTGLTNNAAYSFRVRAVNGRGSGTFSTVRTISTKLVPISPNKPVVQARNKGALVSWLLPGNNKGAQAPTRVILQRSTNGTTWTTVYNMLPVVKQVPVIGLTNGVNYQFRLITVNGLGQSLPSAVTIAKPHA